MEKTTPTAYKVSERTAAYFDVLKQVQELHNAYCNAAEIEVQEYNQGGLLQDKKVEEFAAIMQPVEAFIWKEIETSITDNLLLELNSAGDTL